MEFFDATLGFGLAQPGLAEIFFATFLSFGLTALIAALYKSTFRGPKLSQDYVHTLMILGIIVTVIVMVVRGGDRDQAMATGFGMFAAFSLIRFRTTLAEARDIGFIFFAMAAGLAVGARQYGLAAATTIVICAIIYSFSRGNWFAPNRASGTLRAYRKHRVNDDVLANAGEQDMTAHVNFTAIERVGGAVGLRTDSIITQAQFLTDIAQRAWREGSGFGAWTKDHTRQFQTLTVKEESPLLLVLLSDE